MPELLWDNAAFVEADIRVYAILSFQWLVRKKIGVLPHLRALALAEPEMTLLMGLPKVRRYRVSKVEAKNENSQNGIRNRRKKNRSWWWENQRSYGRHVGVVESEKKGSHRKKWG